MSTFVFLIVFCIVIYVYVLTGFFQNPNIHPMIKTTPILILLLAKYKFDKKSDKRD